MAKKKPTLTRKAIAASKEFKWFTASAKKWAFRTGVDALFMIQIRPCRPCDMPIELKDSMAVTMWSSNDTEAAIYFNMQQLKGRSKEVIEQTARHEIMHLVTTPLWNEVLRLVGNKGEVYERLHEVHEGLIDRLAYLFGYLVEPN